MKTNEYTPADEAARLRENYIQVYFNNPGKTGLNANRTGFTNPAVQDAWATWQAARALVIIEPQALCSHQITKIAGEWVKTRGWFDFDANSLVSFVREIITLAGVQSSAK